MKPLAQQNLYEILDVPFDATTAAIAEAVERAQALYAPGSLATYTLMDPDEEQLLARLIEEARVTLLDPLARARYDERLTGPEQPPAEASPPPASSPPVMDPALRAAWPELPPVIPAARPADEEWEEDLPVPPVIPAAGAPEPEARAAEPIPEPAPPPAAEPPAAPRPPPILLSREVAAPSATPATTPVPAAMPTAQPPAAPAVGEATVWSGEVLRKLREARGISLQQISDRTKVTRHHVENIEADRFELLPASVYLRGILLSIARELRLDGQKVARSYLERVQAACAATSPIPRQR